MKSGYLLKKPAKRPNSPECSSFLLLRQKGSDNIPNWTKEQAFGILTREAKSKAQAEYNVGRVQIMLLGYTLEEYHKEFCSEYSESEIEEFSREFEKANEKVMKERDKMSQ